MGADGQGFFEKRHDEFTCGGCVSVKRDAVAICLRQPMPCVKKPARSDCIPPEPSEGESF